MSFHNNVFRPGVILNEVIVGCMKAKGQSFRAWCEANDVPRGTAQQAIYGQMGGPRGQALLERIILAADPEMVEAAYRKRMEMEAERLKAVA